MARFSTLPCEKLMASMKRAKWPTFRMAEDLKGLQRSVRLGRAGSHERIQRRLGKLEERWSRVWPLIQGPKVEGRELS